MGKEIPPQNSIREEPPYRCPYFDNRACPRYCLDSIIYQNPGSTVSLGRCPRFEDSYVLLSTPAAGLKDYYDASRLEEYRAYYEPFRRRRFADLFRLPILNSYSGISALDIGCGFGWFLEELRKRGWNRLVGIDYSPVVPRSAGEGLEIVNRKFGPELELEEEFDLIILSNVLEHLWQPLDCLRWIRDHLRRESGGLLLLVVPTADGLLMRLSHRIIRDFPRLADRMVEDIYQTGSTMGHRVLYSTAGVIKLCRMAGLTVLDREVTPIIDTGNIRRRMLIEKDRLSAPDQLKAFLLKQLARLATRRGEDDELALVLTPA